MSVRYSNTIIRNVGVEEEEEEDGENEVTVELSPEPFKMKRKSMNGEGSSSSSSLFTQGTRKLEDFEIGATLGVGSFGRVKFCTLKDKTLKKNNQYIGPYMAMKMLKKNEVIRLNQLTHIIAEKEILKEISSGRKRPPHPFIVTFFTSFQDKNFVYMVLEYVNGGEFFTHLRGMGCFEDHIAKFYAASVTSVFEFLHEDDIVYRDLKPENLLLSHNGFLKVTDFGFAKKVVYKTYTLCGTPEYIAPEVLLNQGHGKGVDWWALGILIYEMLAGTPPFTNDEPMEVYKLVVKGKVEFPRWFGSNAKSIIRHLLVLNVTKRFGCMSNGVFDIKNHRWFEDLSFEDLYHKRLAPPLLPTTNGPDDTSNFENYENQEEDDEDDQIVFEEEFIYKGADPFLAF